jgi:hypothetical protein
VVCSSPWSFADHEIALPGGEVKIESGGEASVRGAVWHRAGGKEAQLLLGADEAEELYRALIGPAAQVSWSSPRWRCDRLDPRTGIEVARPDQVNLGYVAGPACRRRRVRHSFGLEPARRWRVVVPAHARIRSIAFSGTTTAPSF